MVNKGSQARLSATNMGIRPGGFPIGSAQSRAAARSMANARKGRQAEEDWDKEFDTTGLAEYLAAARQRGKREGASAMDWSYIHIPPGKENTFRGRLAARMNEARARMSQWRADRAGEVENA